MRYSIVEESDCKINFLRNVSLLIYVKDMRIEGPRRAHTSSSFDTVTLSEEFQPHMSICHSVQQNLICSFSEKFSFICSPDRMCRNNVVLNRPVMSLVRD